MFDRRMSVVLSAVVALLGALSIAVPTAAAGTPTTLVPACSGINIRAGTSTASPVRVTLAANATVTVAGTVSGGGWKTSCPTAKAGSTWYRITAINGKAVKATHGATYLYAATGVLTAAPSPVTTSTDAFALDLMRLINLDRKALGKTPYLIDPRLAEIARNARFSCPTNHAKAFNGRARDMADRSYFAHTVPGCFSSGTTPFRSVEIVRRVFGYAGARSEILHWNAYPSTKSTTYRLGCDIDGKKCKDASTSAPYTVALAQRNFMSSAPHRAAELNSYQRFGCGTARAPGTSKTYFACLFADGGSTIPVVTPAPAPTRDRDDGAGLRSREPEDRHIDDEVGQGPPRDLCPSQRRRDREWLPLGDILPDRQIGPRLVPHLGRQRQVGEDPLRRDLAVRRDRSPEEDILTVGAQAPGAYLPA